jgi:nitrile hydratase
MDGVHDLGGKEGFGPIDADEREVPFHYPWEGRMWSIAMLTDAADWTIDWWRHVRELIDPADYLTRRYFDQWMQTQTAALIDSGVLTLQDVAAGDRVSAPSLTGSPIQRRDVVKMVASFAKDYSRKIDTPPHFAKGERVRARLMGAVGHTRLPAYVRGRIGIVHEHHGAHILPDASARGEERAEHLYSVVFKADMLWPEASSRHDKVFLDLWESYLERP